VGRTFLLLAANTPWVCALGDALAAHGAVTAVRLYDWASYLRHKPKWPKETSPVRRLMVALPPGYAGRLEPMFRPLLQAFVAREGNRLKRRGGADPIVVCPYPHLAPWVRGIPNDRLVYYNLDDYTLYDPSRAARTTVLEDELIDRARLSLCLSAHQVRALRARHPDRAGRIAHFPLGVVDEFLNPEPRRPPLPRTVGYVGNLTSRVDWRFVERVAALVPEVTFYFIGGLHALRTDAEAAGWCEAREQALGLANVIHEGAVPQRAVGEHYWRYAVNWMPYAMDHPFNMASCPTKIMDALASGRPFLATDIPEVRLYPDYIPICRTPEEAAAALRLRLTRTPVHDVLAQVAFAATQTWAHRACEMLALLDKAGETACHAASMVSAAPSLSRGLGKSVAPS
jgi:glycosyltransferase involved in cell wall biosynthesis